MADRHPIGDANVAASADSPTPARPASRQAAAKIGLLTTLGALMAFSSISTDLYLPAMPSLTSYFHVSASRIQLTLSSFLVGFSLGQLLWGPISDRFGRRVPLICGLVLFVVGCVGCAMAASASEIIAWRVVQAIGACSGPVIARAMVRDLYSRERAAQMLSMLMLIMAIAPLLGPMAGAEILSIASWRIIFWTLCIVGMAIAIAVFLQSETLPAERRTTVPLWKSVAYYGVLIRNPKLVAYALSGGFFYAGIYAYVAGTPFAYISYYHLSPKAYGPLFAINIVGLMAINYVNARLVGRLGSDRILRIGSAVAALAGIAVAATAWSGWGGIAGLAVPLFVYNAMVGPIVANSVAGALDTSPKALGSASALVGGIHYGSAIVGAAAVAWCADGTPWPMAWIIAVCGIGSIATALTLRRTDRPSDSIANSHPRRLKRSPVAETCVK